MVDAGDERPHLPGPGRWWGESWCIEVVTPGGAVGAFLRLELCPNDGTAWVWSAVLGPDRPLVALRDHHVPLPAGRLLEVRASGLWAELTCETPWEHWTVGLEAFGLAFPDPAEAFGRERGDRVALGMELEWEATSPPPGGVSAVSAGGVGYRQAGAVHGEILVGRERVAVDGRGHRSHSWGSRAWWSHGWCEAQGQLDDGTDVHVPDVRVELDGVGLPRSAASYGGGVAIDPVAHAPILVPGPDGRAARLSRSLCRLGAADGLAGDAWLERNEPPRSSEVSPGDRAGG